MTDDKASPEASFKNHLENLQIDFLFFHLKDNYPALFAKRSDLFIEYYDDTTNLIFINDLDRQQFPLNLNVFNLKSLGPNLALREL